MTKYYNTAEVRKQLRAHLDKGDNIIRLIAYTKDEDGSKTVQDIFEFNVTAEYPRQHTCFTKNKLLRAPICRMIEDSFINRTDFFELEIANYEGNH